MRADVCMGIDHGWGGQVPPEFGAGWTPMGVCIQNKKVPVNKYFNSVAF